MYEKGFFKILKRNREYIMHYAAIMLKQRVAGSYLGLLWLIIQPLMFMLIYTFVVTIIFNNSMKNFNVFVLIGSNAWTFFQRTVQTSATSIVRNKSIFEQVYFHKMVYPAIYLVSYLYEFLISTSLVFIMMLVSGIPITWHVLEMIPVTIVFALFTYGCALILSHIGVYLFDLANILEFSLRFIFYFTPVMWSFDNRTIPLDWILKLNPVSVLIGSYRSCFFYGTSPKYIYLLILTIFSMVLVYIGYSLITKYENTYARII